MITWGYIQKLQRYVNVVKLSDLILATIVTAKAATTTSSSQLVVILDDLDVADSSFVNQWVRHSKVRVAPAATIQLLRRCHGVRLNVVVVVHYRGFEHVGALFEFGQFKLLLTPEDRVVDLDALFYQSQVPGSVQLHFRCVGAGLDFI